MVDDTYHDTFHPEEVGSTYGTQNMILRVCSSTCFFKNPHHSCNPVEHAGAAGGDGLAVRRRHPGTRSASIAPPLILAAVPMPPPKHAGAP